MTPETVSEAPLKRMQGGGLAPDGDGWFVVNVADTQAYSRPGLSALFDFEGEHDFPQFGITIQVLEPGRPNCMYHRETNQEDFLVLQGECVAIVEGCERSLKQWDFLHCPPGTNHVFVGAGDGPCAILMVGARAPDEVITYPVDEVAASHGASVEQQTHKPREAYARFGNYEPVEQAWPLS